jgi:hypothetical protein
MTDLIPLVRVKEQHLVGIGDRLIVPDVPQVNAAIGKYKMRGRGAFFHAAMTARAAAPDVPQRHGIRIQQAADFVLGWGGHTEVIIPNVHRACGEALRAVAVAET